MEERLQRDPEYAATRGLTLLQELALKQADLAKEWSEAWDQFSQGGEPLPKGQEPGSPAFGRFREWFLLERHSPCLMGTPLDKLIGEWREAHPGLEAHAEPMLTASFTGIFEVGEIVDGQGAWIRDITGFGEFALADPKSADQLQTGDLLVGRLYPIPGSLHLPSGSAAWFRSDELRSALERDLGKLREGRRKIIRLVAPQLEAMFFHKDWAPSEGSPPIQKSAPADPTVLISEARDFLVRAGWPLDRIEATFAEMAAHRIDPAQWTTTPEDPVGRALEALAFDSSVELSEARTRLTQAWSAIWTSQSVEQAKKNPKRQAGAQEPNNPREAVERFSEARAAGGDLEGLLDELQRNLGLAPEPEVDDGAPVPDFPGVVGAMIEEFYWDQERQGQPIPGRPLQPFAEYTRQIGLFEDLSQREVLSFATFWVLEKRILTGEKQAQQTVDALQAFCRWAAQEHGLALQERVTHVLHSVRDTLPRIARINQRWSVATEDGQDPGQLLTVRDASKPDACALEDLSGSAYTAALPKGLAQELQPGDHLRAKISLEGQAEIHCIYPPEARELHQGH